MNLGKIELDAKQLKASTIWIIKRIEEEKYLLSDIGGKICCRFLQVKHKKVIRKQDTEQSIFCINMHN